MSNRQYYLTFDNVISDDFVFSESGDIDVPGGLSVAFAIIEILQSMRFETSKPAKHGYYGWEFSVKKDRQKYWFLLQYLESWLLIAKDTTGIIGRLIKTDVTFESILLELEQRLEVATGFANVKRFTRDEYESYSHKSKVSN